MNRRTVLASIALLASLATRTGHAACMATSQTLVRARFGRCENADHYLEASGAYEIYERAQREALARIDPSRHDEYLERVGGVFPPDDYEARVLVAFADWQLTIDPWLPGQSQAVRAQGEALRIGDTFRYWWNGSVDACEALAEGSALDLWVRPDCCDTIPGSPACIVGLRLAEPANATMSAALSAAIGSR